MKHRTGPQALLTLGMHRSGTSALTGVLNCCGVQLGPRLYPPQSGVNDKGFFEHGPVAEINDRILYALGSCWDDILALPDDWTTHPDLAALRERLAATLEKDFCRAELWGLKDPRMCRLLPLWQPLLAELGVSPSYLLIYRHPMAVAASLAKRDGFSVDKGLLLWLDHNLQAEWHTRGNARALMDFDTLLDAPLAALDRATDQLSLTLPVPLARAATHIDQFLSTDLRRNRPSELARDTPLGALADQVYSVLNAAADDGDEPDPEALDAARNQMERYRAEFPPLLVEQLRALGRAHGAARTMGERIFNSWSWTAAKPLRLIDRLTGGDI